LEVQPGRLFSVIDLYRNAVQLPLFIESKHADKVKLHYTPITGTRWTFIPARVCSRAVIAPQNAVIIGSPPGTNLIDAHCAILNDILLHIRACSGSENPGLLQFFFDLFKTVHFPQRDAGFI